MSFSKARILSLSLAQHIYQSCFECLLSLCLVARDICDLSDQYKALVFVDDAHASGFFGPTGRGTEEYCGLSQRVHIINSTLGKALGGAAGTVV